jgi:hypothetical protein
VVWGAGWFTAAFALFAAVLGAAAAAGSLAKARMAEDRALLQASECLTEEGLTEGKVRELLLVNQRGKTAGAGPSRDPPLLNLLPAKEPW